MQILTHGMVEPDPETNGKNGMLFFRAACYGRWAGEKRWVALISYYIMIGLSRVATAAKAPSECVRVLE